MIYSIRKENYKIVRYIAVFIIGPLLISRGLHHKDNIIILIGIGLIIWDGLKIYYDP
tara:strand:- start:453 stop:623 length:171 start_codon:yes stop_codon:yes gene_type:complete